MNKLKRIYIENVKGKDKLECKFNDLIGNCPNIIVAQNGFGKSTIAKTFQSLKPTKLLLDSVDEYKNKGKVYPPKVELEIEGIVDGIFVADSNKNDISKQIDVFVINSSLYAKSLTRYVGNGVRGSSAELRVHDIVLYGRIPEKVDLGYSVRYIKQKCKASKFIVNIEPLLENLDNLLILKKCSGSMFKCFSLKTVCKMLENLDQDLSGYDINQKAVIDKKYIDAVLGNPYVKDVFASVSLMNHSAYDNWYDIDNLLVILQLYRLFTNVQYPKKLLNSVIEYKQYCQAKNLINVRLEEFNTTGRRLICHEENGRLLVKFDKADSMSNGERDILSFVVQLIKIEISFRKKCGLLIIDEVFDYLDGCNMLAVQYYLSKFIEVCKEEGKVIYPVIMTHLDPENFSNYYFSKKKIHYVSCTGYVDLNADTVSLIKWRELIGKGNPVYDDISLYYFHYTDCVYTIPSVVQNQYRFIYVTDNIILRNRLYQTVLTRYLKGRSYNPFDVLYALRLRIEQNVYEMLSTDETSEFLSKHTTKKKLEYAQQLNYEIPELYFLLEPLYNDGLHLKNDFEMRHKFKSSVLKLDNLHIKKMISCVFNK